MLFRSERVGAKQGSGAVSQAAVTVGSRCSADTVGSYEIFTLRRRVQDSKNLQSLTLIRDSCLTEMVEVREVHRVPLFVRQHRHRRIIAVQQLYVDTPCYQVLGIPPAPKHRLSHNMLKRKA